VESAFAISALGSFAVALACTWLVAKNASRLGLMDVPNARSSHQFSTPRGGGLGIVAGVAAGVLLLAAFGLPASGPLEVLLLGAGAIAVLGAIDDLHRLPAAYRLVGHILVSTVVVIALGPRSSTGYSLRILRVVERHRGIYVYTREKTPSLGDPVKPRITYPYRVLSMHGSAKPVYVKLEGRP